MLPMKHRPCAVMPWRAWRICPGGATPLLSELTHLDERIALHDRHIAQLAREDTRAQQLMRPSGIGETTATLRCWP